MPLARVCCIHQKVKQGWPPHLHRAISSPSSTKIKSVVILRKITSWFGDKEGRHLHNKIYFSVGCSLWIHLFLTGLEDLLELHLADRNISNSNFPFSCCSSPLLSVQSPPLREPWQISAVIRLPCTSPMTVGWISPSLIPSQLLPNWLLQPRKETACTVLFLARGTASLWKRTYMKITKVLFKNITCETLTGSGWRACKVMKCWIYNCPVFRTGD